MIKGKQSDILYLKQEIQFYRIEKELQMDPIK